MLRNLILTTVALASSVATASAQDEPFSRIRSADPGAYAARSGRAARRFAYHVQIRRPYWEAQTFSARRAMAAFADKQRANGWEVQLLPQAPGSFPVRYRLMKWGGSRVLPTRDEAEDWADELEEDGYETRIVRIPK
jgi:hypothetical protein